jgi:hypothetical protein
MAEDLLTQLRAALDEDERVALAEIEGQRNAEYPRYFGHQARHDPARVLRWVAAAREVLDRHRVIEFTTRHGKKIADCTWCSDTRGDSTEDWPCPDVRALAGVYGIGEG